MIIHGDEDDCTLPKRSRLWFHYIKRERPDAKLECEIQIGGKHSFMSDSLAWNRYVGNYANASNCPTFLVPGPLKALLTDGAIREVNALPDFQPLFEACLTKSGSVGYTRSAAQGEMEKRSDLWRQR